jgi:hypothetical protein
LRDEEKAGPGDEHLGPSFSSGSYWAEFVIASAATAAGNPDGIRTPAELHPDTTASASAVTDAVVMLVVPPPVVSSPSALNAVASDRDMSELPCGSLSVPPSVGPCRAAPTASRSRPPGSSPLSAISAEADGTSPLHAALSAGLVSVTEEPPPAAAADEAAGAAGVFWLAADELAVLPHAVIPSIMPPEITPAVVMYLRAFIILPPLSPRASRDACTTVPPSRKLSVTAADSFRLSIIAWDN